MMGGNEWKTIKSGQAGLVEAIRRQLPAGVRHPNLLLVPAGDVSEMLREYLSSRFPVHLVEVEPPPAECQCLAIDCSRPETVRDAIKERLWLARPKVCPQAVMADILMARYDKIAPDLRMDDFGVFIPCRTRSFQEVRTHSFDHTPGYYRYRLARARTVRLPEPMADFLHAQFTDCPNHLFRNTTLRASRVRRGGLAVEIPLRKAASHDIIALAGESHRHETVSSRHENLQKYFLECDPTTVACEVPVWIEPWEFADYARILGSGDTLTGHIDVLRAEPDGRIGVWDYKPRAAAERHAHIQVFLYALMLALRTGLPLTAFTCGYFDEKDAYVFDPSEAHSIPRA